MDSFEILFAPRDCFLCLLADGWCLPFIVEPGPGRPLRYVEYWEPPL